MGPENPETTAPSALGEEDRENFLASEIVGAVAGVEDAAEKAYDFGKKIQADTRKENLIKLYSSSKERKIGRQIDELCKSFGKRLGETKSSQSATVDEFVKNIWSTNSFWSSDRRRWKKVTDYFRIVYKDSPETNLKDFLIYEAGHHSLESIDLLFPYLLKDVARPLPSMPEGKSSTDDNTSKKKSN